ncbi:ribosomal protein S18 acetylase RimI-like enzyme [Natronobacillus azotifigens]|uniref:GNAT family N-acetyltransferase n=1 Tax=Natronobacillus azotifigens TaxID=472978 RepID=A0A9J6RDL1_9BACI|nr:GNAT family N-acetyltransferase [Natronobacillus azotifigens]MCZ0703435.1 GNAT family N-acetyltransferase [Natronobacillus azotifigens]
MISHIAIHPDYHRRGIGEALLKEAEKRAIERKLNRFEAWTRDDQWVRNWYEKMNSSQTETYYHVYFKGNQMNEIMHTKVPDLFLVNSFAHYVGDDIEQFSEKTNRIHQCACYVKHFS